jgi:hypothetical protein
MLTRCSPRAFFLAGLFWAFSLNSVTTVQAIACATGYNNSAVATEVFKFQTPASCYPITINMSATPARSGKVLQLNPIVLTLIVN